MSSTAHSLSAFPSFFAETAWTAPKPTSPVRRRATREQGEALEILSHAIEYLVDSHLYRANEFDADGPAIRLLMNCSRAVFAEGEQVYTLRQKVQRAIFRRATQPGPNC